MRAALACSSINTTGGATLAVEARPVAVSAALKALASLAAKRTPRLREASR